MILLQSYFVFLLSTAEEALINLPTSCSQSLDVIDVMRVLKLSEHPRRDLFYLTLAHFTLRSLFFFFHALDWKVFTALRFKAIWPSQWWPPR